VHDFTHALAKDAAPYSINVNVVASGIVRTPMQVTADQMAGRSGTWATEDEVLKRMVDIMTILKREATSEDVSIAVVFPAGKESHNIQGSEIYVDGGCNAV
jgi:NAD(P)-dependent dehydrogenase (short-subunit alcohol dehydrogenase family)